MNGPEIVTFGCRLNAYESEVMRGQATAAGLDEGAVIVNTCAVTAEAERQARQAIRRLKRERPEARIIVTGCAAQVNPQSFADMPEVDRVLGNAEKVRAETWRAPPPGRIHVTDVMVLRETAPHLIAGFEGRTRAFVEVQQGCDHRCTFCIIPFGRGPNRSVALGPLAEQVRALVARGFREVVLTGVDIGAYGGDLPGRPRLGNMVRRLLAQVPDLARLRLSSLDPGDFDPDLLAVIAAEPRLMPHFHLSVQAGDDMVLKRMKRRHSRDDVAALAESLLAARPGCALGADVIAGFPTETDAMFENTLALVEACGFTHLHVFPFSKRPGTPAARMPQVRGDVARARAARLRRAGADALDSFQRARLGQTARVLVEKDGVGLCEHYLPVAVRGGAPEGALLTLRLTRIEDGRLVGEPA